MRIPGAADDPTIVAAGKAIRDHADGIVARWVERVASEPEIPDAHWHDLRDHLPQLLERLGRDLVEGGDVQSERTEEAAEKHGRQRWHLGWRLEEVVRDYQTLRPVIEEFLSEQLEQTLLPPVMSTIASMIDEAIVDSVRSFAEFHATLENESHRTAAEFAAIVSSSSDAIISMSMEGKIQSWNSAAETMYGYSTDEVVGQPATVTIPPERHAELGRVLAQVARGTAVNFDTVRVTKAGKSKVVAVSASPIHNRSGQPIGCATIERDITLRTKTAQALRHALEEAEVANRTKSEFLANVSHELRTPMNAIIGMTTLTLEDDLDPTVRDNLQTAREAADQLLRLVDDLLDLSKLSSGKFELEERPFSLRGTLEETMRLASVQAFQKGLEIVFHVDENVPDDLRGDAMRLRQVIANLVGNAVKFTDQGEIALDVSLEHTTVDSCAISFRVVDTGIGIAQTDLQRIFTPFSQADASAMRPERGTGLGLSIASHLVICLGGQLKVDSTLGKGSTFSFVGQFRHTPKHRREPHPDSTGSQLRDIPVLVVDDNESNRLIVEELLERWGMLCASVDNAQAALEQLREANRQDQPFQIVLIDAFMPQEDGFALAAEIADLQDVDPATILMISPGDRLTFRERCQSARVDGFLDKPVGQSGLFNTILGTLSSTHLDDERSVSSSAAPGAAEPLQILLVEDTAANRKVVERVLGKRGHVLTAANNGREALELARMQPFDVILMDVQMPIMDGFQATAAIREWEHAHGVAPRVPIIAMTAHAMRGDRDRCLAAGMTDYISKPIDVTALARVVEQYGGQTGKAPFADDPAGQDWTTSPAPGSATASEVEDARGKRESADLHSALKRLRGDQALLAELIECFAADHAELLEEITQALAQEDFETSHRASHSLKSLAATFNARLTPELAATLERASRERNLQEASRVLPPLREAAQELAQLLVSHSSTN